MRAQEHSTAREGLLTGLLGAIVVAVWYAVCDVAGARPLHTFNVLGRVLLQGDVNPGARALDAGAVGGFLVLHLLVFLLAGTALTFLVHLASRNLALRMGVWIGLVVAFCFLLGLTYMLNVSTADRLPLWEVLGGAALGVGTMAWVLWRRHPRLGRSLDQVPLGDEVRTPPHAPGGPRV
jgi:hypothetical protein